jgi:hypothetical protein
MLAIARALMSRPKMLLLDEPSLGLAPLIVQQIFDIIRNINEKENGTTIYWWSRMPTWPCRSPTGAMYWKPARSPWKTMPKAFCITPRFGKPTWGKPNRVPGGGFLSHNALPGRNSRKRCFVPAAKGVPIGPMFFTFSTT